MTRLALILATLLVGASALAGPAAAADYPPDAQGVEVSRDSVRPGETVLVVGGGFCPNSLVTVWLVSRDSQRAQSSRKGRRLAVGKVRASAAGTVRRRVRIPRRTRPGLYRLALVGRGSDCRSSRRIAAPLRVKGKGRDATEPSAPQDEAAAGDPAGGSEPPASASGGANVGPLPFTGLQLILLAVAGAALLAVGVGLRRRVRV